MNQFQIEIQIISIIVATACVIPGVFLVLRKISLISDAISHAILFGIVISFAIVKNYNSPLLIIGASLTGLIVVLLVNLLTKTRLIKEDASIGLVFPLLFSIGVILITRNFSNVHIDVDAVLLGEIAFTPFDRLIISGIDFGPKSMYTMGLILIINLIMLILLFKELKISTFDPTLAAAIGISPIIINYVLMTSVSITAVGAFDSVGSILVVALMIAPPASAYIISKNLSSMILSSIIIAVLSAISGFWLALLLDVNIAGTIATMTGVFFLLVFLFAPQNGIISKMRKSRKQKIEFAQIMMLIHILNHSNTANFKNECSTISIFKHLGWEKDFSQNIITSLLKNKYAFIKNDVLHTTDKGRKLAEKSVIYEKTRK